MNTVRNEQGAALVTALIFLIVLTLIAVGSVQNVNLQQNMTSAVRQGYVALEVAEVGLREGQDLLMSYATQGAFTVEDNSGLYDSGGAGSPWTMDWATEAIEGDGVTIDGKTYKTQYFIERIGPLNAQQDLQEITTGNVQNSQGVNMGYRIVARGVGNDGVTERILETYVARVF